MVNMIRLRSPLLVMSLSVVLCACSSEGNDESHDLSIVPDAKSAMDTVFPDTKADVDAGADSGGDSSPDAAPDASSVLDMVQSDLPSFGGLVIEQIHLDVMMGESALVVGPDGTSVLIDTGGDPHANQIIEVINRRLGKPAVDWVVTTHLHSDHLGAFEKLFAPSAANGNQPLSINLGVIDRGFFDLAASYMQSDTQVQQYCAEVNTSKYSGKRFELCTGPQPAPCDGQGAGAPWVASGCPGLLLGDLLDPGDDSQGALTYINLGEGSRLTFFSINAHVATDNGVVYAEDEGIAIGHGGTFAENARSLGAVIRWGDFHYLFNGDLTGGQWMTAPDAEGFIVAHADTIVEHPGGPLLVSDGDIDVLQLNHHGYGDASGQAWVDWLLPSDGQSRNAVFGCNQMYAFAPDANALKRVGARVQGGYIWMTVPGTLGATHPRLRTAMGAVVVEVTDGGSLYEVSTWTSQGKQQTESFASTN